MSFSEESRLNLRRSARKDRQSWADQLLLPLCRGTAGAVMGKGGKEVGKSAPASSPTRVAESPQAAQPQQQGSDYETRFLAALQSMRGDVEMTDDSVRDAISKLTPQQKQQLMQEAGGQELKREMLTREDHKEERSMYFKEVNRSNDKAGLPVDKDNDFLAKKVGSAPPPRDAARAPPSRARSLARPLRAPEPERRPRSRSAAPRRAAFGPHEELARRDPAAAARGRVGLDAIPRQGRPRGGPRRVRGRRRRRLRLRPRRDRGGAERTQGVLVPGRRGPRARARLVLVRMLLPMRLLLLMRLLVRLCACSC